MRIAARQGTPPALIGPYPVIEQIGEGGFGEVFLAHDRSADRRVCIKRAHAHLADDERFRALFVDESRVARRLANEHIAQIIDAGQDEGGLPYLVLEYVEGTDLAQLLRTMPGCRLPPELAGYVVLALARALDHAHAAAIIHRDVKPANVLLGADGRVKLADFGIARLQRGGAYAVTATRHEMGSEPYMAPELLGPETLLRFDHRVDLWSLGVLAWECLCGFRPFEDPALGARPDLAAGQWAQLNAQCVPPRRRSIHEVAPEAPQTLRSVVEELLQPVERRVTRAGEVVSRLLDAGFGAPEQRVSLAELVTRDTIPRGSGVRPAEGAGMHDDEPSTRRETGPLVEPSTDLSVATPIDGQPGTRVGPFTIVREIGSGGMGATYVARREDVEKRVCLKIVRAEHAADPRYREMFLAEARTAAKASHPNVVSLIDFGQHASGELWAAYDLVDGADLASLLKKTGGSLHPDVAALIANDLASGLLHLHTPDHRRGVIVHRDVSRNNVMVSYDGVAVLIDLGIAKVMAGPSTHTDMRGKIPYMAPEVLRGDPIGPAVDQWALGVVLYGVITGRLPYRGAYDGTSPPPLQSPHVALDARWSSIVGRLLQPDPQRRYPSLAAMLDELAPLIPPPAARRQLGHLVRHRAPSKSMPATEAHRPDPEVAPDPLPAAPPAPRREIGAMRPGERFGEWVIEGKLGTGGMAVVYKASRARTLGGAQTAALKLIRPEHAASDDFVTRFRSEVEIAMRLNHQNIVHVLDAGEVDGVYFMAMEFVEGCDVDTLVRALTTRGVLSERRLPPDLALFIGAGVLHALEYAHAKGVVHRDTTPHNVMVTVAGEVKLNDFGVAKSMSADGMASKTSHAIGKPHYMPPEQFRGDPLDGRADLFAAGVSVYEMLAGVTPYAARGAPNETVHMVLKRIFENDRPHTAEVAPHAPAELIEVLESLLQPNRDHRPPSAEHVLTRLEPLVQLQSKRVLAELVRAVRDEPAGPISASVLEAVRVPSAPGVAVARPSGTVPLPPAAAMSGSPASSPAPSASTRKLVLAVVILALAAVSLAAFGAVLLWPDSPARPQADQSTERPDTTAEQTPTSGIDSPALPAAPVEPPGEAAATPVPPPAPEARLPESGQRAEELATPSEPPVVADEPTPVHRSRPRADRGRPEVRPLAPTPPPPPSSPPPSVRTRQGDFSGSVF